MADPGDEVPAAPPAADLVRALTTAGWLAYFAWLLFLFRQIERVIRVSDRPFAGPWEQRIEVLSFIVLPPNSLVIVPAAAAAAGATWIAGASQPLELAVLLRLTRWSANLLGAIAVLSVLSSLINDSGSPTRFGDAALRISGLLTAVAVSTLCLAAGRRAPGG